MSDDYEFSERGSAQEVEEGGKLAPKFDADGLLTCIATDAASGELLMVAHMNAAAFARTIESGEAWYFSRSRRSLSPPKHRRARTRHPLCGRWPWAGGG